MVGLMSDGQNNPIPACAPSFDDGKTTNLEKCYGVVHLKQLSRDRLWSYEIRPQHGCRYRFLCTPISVSEHSGTVKCQVHLLPFDESKPICDYCKGDSNKIHILCTWCLKPLSYGKSIFISNLDRGRSWLPTGGYAQPVRTEHCACVAQRLSPDPIIREDPSVYDKQPNPFEGFTPFLDGDTNPEGCGLDNEPIVIMRPTVHKYEKPHQVNLNTWCNSRYQPIGGNFNATVIPTQSTTAVFSHTTDDGRTIKTHFMGCTCCFDTKNIFEFSLCDSRFCEKPWESPMSKVD